MSAVRTNSSARKEVLVWPRIASELSGPAKRVLLGRPADWLSFDGGLGVC